MNKYDNMCVCVCHENRSMCVTNLLGFQGTCQTEGERRSVQIIFLKLFAVVDHLLQ